MICIDNGRLAKFLSAGLLFLLSFFPPDTLTSQAVRDQIRITDEGIMQYSRNRQEVQGFGVNYTVPFAHAYRSAQRMGLDLKKIIDQDVHHFHRLGLDLFRVHVWDCEISDTLGHLMDNEHLELFDYLLFRLKENGINSIVTPIAFWGNGWPEPDEPTPGFSTRYGKDNCLTDPDAIKAQQTYLTEFVSHVNRYTGVAFKNEPSILAFEVSNEPHHQGTPEEVTEFVRKMKAAIASTGSTKPVFYNVSHMVHLAEAYYEAGIDGGTFQWYPTGLGFQKELGGNMLPNVDRYTIPFDPVLKDNSSARIVYEFDAADMASTYMYPAMARSFRTAGIQLATHFSYDPTFLAPYNTEYNTHYMNLIYAPRKALSLMICAEIFRTMPLYTDYGIYPENTRFGPFRVDYEKDLAEMMTASKFYYTHHTETMPSDPDQLQHIAGWGNSPVVSYEGTGAYFLDKIGNGLWTLEVLPDAIHIDNLFGRNSTDKTRAVIHFAPWRMQLNLPDLQKGFVVLNIRNEEFIPTEGAAFTVMPGKYMLMSIDFSQLELSQYDFPDNASLEKFSADQLRTTLSEKYVLHEPLPECTADEPLAISAVIASPTMPDSVDLWVNDGWTPTSIRMHRVHGYTYAAEIPGEWVEEGAMPYWITTYYGQTPQTYPAGMVSKPGDWNFDQSQAYTVKSVPAKHPIYLFDANTDVQRLNRTWLRDSRVMPGKDKGEDWLYIKVPALIRPDNENQNGPRIADYSMQHYFGDIVLGRKDDLTGKNTIVLRAQALPRKPVPIQIKLVMEDGQSFGTIVQLRPGKSRYSIPIRKLRPVRAVLLPRPYPTFLPYYSAILAEGLVDLSRVERVQFSMGPGVSRDNINKPYEVMIRSVSLE